jgi:NAD(P)-dependent dehydrogenase (short-subunit alcohol dehydrogenase family)
MRLDGKTIIITGAASGIGQASAAKALAEGARVIGVDLAGDGMPEGVEPILGDVCDDDTIARAVAAAGPVDGLATIAGISNSGVAIDAIDPDTWERIFAVNVQATWRWMIGVLPAMRAGGGGSVVAIASQLAFGGGRNNAAYIASKGAIVSLVKTAAFELAPDNIRVNAVAPGAIDTPMLNRSMARAPDPAVAREYSRNRHALKRFGKAGEIANGIVYLLSSEASFTTGSVLTIDGGWRAA